MCTSTTVVSTRDRICFLGVVSLYSSRPQSQMQSIEDVLLVDTYSFLAFVLRRLRAGSDEDDTRGDWSSRGLK